LSDGGGDVSDSSAKTDGGTDADAALSMCGTATTGGSGDGCNTIVPLGDCVVPTASSDAPPTAAGGTLTAGTYDLVSKTTYASVDGGSDAGIQPDPTPARETSVVSGSGNTLTFQNAVVSGTQAARVSGSVTTDGSTMVTATLSCPFNDGGNNMGGTFGYTVTETASGTTLTTFSIDGGSGHLDVKVYKKRN
jgi:hypothetical protein